MKKYVCQDRKSEEKLDKLHYFLLWYVKSFMQYHYKNND